MKTLLALLLLCSPVFGQAIYTLTNYTNPFSLSGGHIFLSADFNGTIHIGTNAYIKKDFDNLERIPKGNYAIWSGPTNIDTSILWIGMLTVGAEATSQEWNAPQLRSFSLPDYEIGLRADGLLAWRHSKTNK